MVACAQRAQRYPAAVSSDGGQGRLQCPYCDSYEIDRLYLASMRVDSCVCTSCGARWDEDTATGEFRGRRSQARTSRTETR